MRVGVIPGTGIVVRDGATVLVVGDVATTSPELPGRLIEAVTTREGPDRLRQLARLALAEADPPALAVATVDDGHAEVFLFGDVDLSWPDGRVSGSDHVLGLTTSVPVGFAIVGAGADVPELAEWNHLDGGSVRGDGVVVSADRTDAPAAVEPAAAEPAAVEPEPEDPDAEEESTGPMAAVDASAPEADGSGSFEFVALTPDADLTGRQPLPIAGQPDESSAVDGPLYERPVQVIGVYSPRGFFNHPDAKYCSRTGVKMGASQTKVLTTGPRPPLGVITLDDGATLTVRWNTVIGRDPELDDRVGRGEAAPFVVTDVGQSVSRRHALLELVDWDVLISDLGSRNKTWIQTNPDEPRRALAAGERTVLRSGTIVHLGDRSFVFNEHHVR